MNILSELYDNTMATGEYARTSTSISLPVRKRSRSRVEPSEPIYKKKKDQGGEASIIVDAINRSIEARKSNITKAIEMLTKEYYTRLPATDFDQAIDLLSDDTKASIFVSLALKDIKDRWLERYAQVVFNDN